ncbi:MAG: inositol monophosphatase [Endomicrobia bacterium]|nr:inositol monophosphatase [Endomicrobiia bacterium]
MKNFLTNLAKEAGEILEDYFNNNKNIKIEYKSKNNPVTQADKETENFIIKKILDKFPYDKIICEESCPVIYTKNDISKIDNTKIYWIIDPLDGTVNFTHKLPVFSISIAIMKNLKIEEAVVYNPITKDLYYAKKNLGAYKNNKKILVSKIKNLYNSLLVTGFPYYTHKDPKRVFTLFKKFATTSQAVRRLGSAALDLCMVAEGIFEGFWEENLQVWDVAAGSLIVSEAGGKVTDYFGNKNYLFGKTIVASNTKIHNQMLKIIKG